MLGVQRLRCGRCGTVRQATLGFADERVRHTRGFERYALQLSRLTTILDAARHLGVGWDLVKDIQKRNLQRRFKRISSLFIYSGTRPDEQFHRSRAVHGSLNRLTMSRIPAQSRTDRAT